MYRIEFEINPDIEICEEWESFYKFGVFKYQAEYIGNIENASKETFIIFRGESGARKFYVRQAVGLRYTNYDGVIIVYNHHTDFSKDVEDFINKYTILDVYKPLLILRKDVFLCENYALNILTIPYEDSPTKIILANEDFFEIKAILDVDPDKYNYDKILKKKEELAKKNK